MISEIIEAKPYHCGQMARLLRKDHKATIEKSGLNVHRQLKAMFDMSSVRKAWVLNGELMMLGGMEGPVLAHEGIIWIALNERVLNYPRYAVIVMRNELEKFFLMKRSLVAFLLSDDEKSVKFARKIGFVPQSTTQLHGMNTITMTLTQESRT